MAKKKDWYPDGRQEQLNWAKNLLSVMTEPVKEGSTQQKGASWGVNNETKTAFALAYGEAQERYQAVLLSGTRGGAPGAALNESLANLEKLARMIHRHYLYSPNVSVEDLARINVKERSATRTPPEDPLRALTVAVSYPAPHAVTFTMTPAPGEQDVSGFTFNMRVGILFPDGKLPERSRNAPLYMTKVPVIPEDIPGQKGRSRKEETWTLSALEAGAAIYFAAAYQNSRGVTGPWTMISAIIT